MSRARFSGSIYFLDTSKVHYFLLQVINIGKEGDTLKFVFNSPSSASEVVYTQSRAEFGTGDFVRPYAEVTYHNDGTVLYKFPKHNNRTETIYKNPHGKGKRRVPIDEIGVWEPIIRGTVVQYGLCRRDPSEDMVMIPENPMIFNGSPFQFVVFLGNLRYANPPNDKATEMLYRINDVARKIDLLVWLYKTDYRGTWLKVGKSDVFMDDNLFEIVERNPDAHPVID
jgi:hypothetical protein